jgi:hypothetical protein
MPPLQQFAETVRRKPMGWKFWQRNDEKDTLTIKLPKPKEIPEKIGRHLVVKEQMDPDLVWKFRCALKPHLQNQTSFDFRVFSQDSVLKAGVTVVNFDSLDAHPELIILQGQFDKRTDQIKIQKK